MKPKNTTPKTIALPDDLSPQAAIALYEVLNEITEKVWKHYEPALVAQIVNEIIPPPHDPDFDDEIPF